MQAVRKMGSLSKIFGMLPGMGQIRDQIENIDERDIDRIAAIIQSMTSAERDDPKIIDGSRRARIARGSGVAVSEVNGLVDRFFEARKMMMAMARGGGAPGMPGAGGMPGMPGMPGVGKRARARQAPKKGRTKRRSGNPAKRAQQDAAEREPEQASSPGAGFGLGDESPGAADADDFELPKELRDLMGR